MNRRWILIAAVAIVAIWASSSTRAATITFSIDNVVGDVPNYENDEGLFVIGEEGEVDPSYEFSHARGAVALEGVLNPDPSIIFAGTAIDFGGPSIFTFTFILPLAPTVSNPSVVSDSLSGSVTNGQAPGGVTVTALGPPPGSGVSADGDGIAEIQYFSLSDDGGLTWQNVGLDSGRTTSVALGAFLSGDYGAYNQGPIATIAGGPWTHMRADVRFQLSGGGDTFTFNGAKVLVPEPGTFALGLLALLGVAGFTRRRGIRSR